MIADQSIELDGVLATPGLPLLRFDPANLPAFLDLLATVMPMIRDAVREDVELRLEVEARLAERIIAYGAFVAGSIQGTLPR